MEVIDDAIQIMGGLGYTDGPCLPASGAMFAANVSVAARMKYDLCGRTRQILKTIRTVRMLPDVLFGLTALRHPGRINQINFAVRYLAANTPLSQTILKFSTIIVGRTSYMPHKQFGKMVTFSYLPAMKFLPVATQCLSAQTWPRSYVVE